MIITDKFVLLDFPKTGTTFTTAVLRTIHARRRLAGRLLPDFSREKVFRKLKLERPGYQEVRIPRVEPIPYHKQRTSRHAGYTEIPAEFAHLPVVSGTRDPLARYTSAVLYRMRSRKRIRHAADPEELKKLYPGYPELDFGQFYDMMHRFEPDRLDLDARPDLELGAHTIAFINTFFRNPGEVFRKIDRDYIESDAWREDIPDIHFLHQENLRLEFKQYLADMGYSESECASVDSFGQKNVAKRSSDEQQIDSFYTPELKNLVLERDALLFRIFPEYLR